MSRKLGSKKEVSRAPDAVADEILEFLKTGEVRELAEIGPEEEALLVSPD